MERQRFSFRAPCCSSCILGNFIGDAVAPFFSPAAVHWLFHKAELPGLGEANQSKTRGYRCHLLSPVSPKAVDTAGKQHCRIPTPSSEPRLRFYPGVGLTTMSSQISSQRNELYSEDCEKAQDWRVCRKAIRRKLVDLVTIYIKPSAAPVTRTSRRVQKSLQGSQLSNHDLKDYSYRRVWIYLIGSDWRAM